MKMRPGAKNAATRTVAKRLLVAAAVLVASAPALQPVNGQSAPPARRYLNGVYAPLPDEKKLEELYEAARRDSTYVDSIKQAREGFSGLNLEQALRSMTEDGQLIDITDAGVSIKVDGREQMRAGMGKSFSGKASSAAGKWIPEKSGSETWGIYKNIKVTYHYSTFIRDDGTEWTRPMIVVVEHKDGKRWREWRFMPVDR